MAHGDERRIAQRLNVIAAEKARVLRLLAIAANDADRRRFESGRRDLEAEGERAQRSAQRSTGSPLRAKHIQVRYQECQFIR